MPAPEGRRARPERLQAKLSEEGSPGAKQRFTQGDARQTGVILARPVWTDFSWPRRPVLGDRNATLCLVPGAHHPCGALTSHFQDDRERSDCSSALLQLPSPQKNPHAKVASLGVTHSATLQSPQPAWQVRSSKGLCDGSRVQGMVVARRLRGESRVGAPALGGPGGSCVGPGGALRGGVMPQQRPVLGCGLGRQAGGQFWEYSHVEPTGSADDYMQL